MPSISLAREVAEGPPNRQLPVDGPPVGLRLAGKGGAARRWPWDYFEAKHLAGLEVESPDSAHRTGPAQG